MRPIVGFDKVMQFQTSLAQFFAKNMSRLLRYGFINGLPGFLTIEHGDILQTTALQIDDGKITAIYVIRNRKSCSTSTASVTDRQSQCELPLRI